MPNQVFLGEDGFIHNIVQGDQDATAAQYIHDQTVKLASQLSVSNRPIKILSDLTDIGKVDSNARRIASNIIQETEVNKVAIFGGNRLMRHMVNLVIKATGKTDRVRYFDAFDQAISWLKS
ncbi:hypothetical protein A2634_01760 [Candidatus Amesbacteria bacterium RIFCSPHIGHO2_01_FULL_48_32]|uniref:DUF7793 domain-containing protein n=1 Tax=Candidatus Amesbacteria bacterium RIFCSPLOWO2_01_FULL_48_25 TaxID=1797259 RepID=A0A1F4ZB02_9BACT|nr:MAG: hypothetical protein A2634_01760 [Candidatus Amesbacteria bacterium RIFCSPHIGHO2_01_FULL_48_32]OGD03385.1 MAG: hypothetical protein A2989_00960 [Candidatus Amesbacteria bacterium RIFCSPLOWO2_01_FULL_48_25]HJZ05002.1 STAS/SEC14 domain-containing protein [Patescibacteria group bacterium]